MSNPQKLLDLLTDSEDSDLLALADRHVRSPEGARKYGSPIGSRITKDMVAQVARGVAVMTPPSKPSRIVRTVPGTKKYAAPGKGTPIKKTPKKKTTKQSKEDFGEAPAKLLAKLQSLGADADTAHFLREKYTDSPKLEKFVAFLETQKGTKKAETDKFAAENPPLGPSPEETAAIHAKTAEVNQKVDTAQKVADAHPEGTPGKEKALTAVAQAKGEQATHNDNVVKTLGTAPELSKSVDPIEQKLSDALDKLAVEPSKPIAKPTALDAKKVKAPSKNVVKKRAKVEKVAKGEKKHGGRGKPEGTGTVDDPIDVKGDIPKALDFLIEGKHVRLNSEKEVGTLLEELRKRTKKATKNNEAPIAFDLCGVSVANTNIFCAGSKRINRSGMPQLKGFPVPGTFADSLPRKKSGKVSVESDFLLELQSRGIGFEDHNWPANQLKATQDQLDGAHVLEIEAELRTTKKPPNPIYVTRDGYILDGHHHWAATVTMDLDDGKSGDIFMPVRVVDMDILEAVELANEFTAAKGIAPKVVAPTTEIQKAATKTKSASSARQRKLAKGKLVGTPARRSVKGSKFYNAFDSAMGAGMLNDTSVGFTTPEEQLQDLRLKLANLGTEDSSV